MRSSLRLAEYALLAVIAILFVSPLLLAGLRRLPAVQNDVCSLWQHDWIASRTLAGLRSLPPPVPFSLESLRRATYQRSVATHFNDTFPAREFLIRLTNEAYYRLLRVSIFRTDAIIFGKDNYLFHQGYLRDYLWFRPAREELLPLARNLAALQEECRRRRLPLAIMITPAKAAIYPEYLPPRWQGREDPRPRASVLLQTLLREEGVRFLDGHTQAMALKAEAPLPLFTKGAIHWSDYLVLHATNALLAMLAQDWPGLVPLEPEMIEATDRPGRADRDMEALLNLARPWRYLSADITIKPAARTGPRPTVAMVGDSFSWKLAEVMQESGQFSEIHSYFYYKLRKTCYLRDYSPLMVAPAPALNIAGDIFGADLLILEVNESNLQMQFLKRFVEDVLAFARAHPGKKAAFPTETLPVYWGETLRFAAGQGTAARFTHGLFQADPQGVWMDGKECLLRVAGPEPASDLLLTARLSALSAPGSTPPSARLYVNGTQVADWTFPNEAPLNHTALIPRDLAKDGRMALRLVVDKTVTPASLGANEVIRALGLHLEEITLEEKAPAPPDNDYFFPVAWETPVSFCRDQAPALPAAALSGFGRAEPVGTWTVGPTAEIRLVAPFVAEDLAIEAEVSAFFPPPAKAREFPITINGKPAGKWQVTPGTSGFQKVVVPRSARRDDGRITLGITIPEPASPLEHGLSPDARKLGVKISRLQVRWEERPRR